MGLMGQRKFKLLSKLNLHSFLAENRFANPPKVPAEDFQALEEKVYRTIELYKAAKEARTAAERDVKRIREQLEEREEENESMRRELVKLRKEREEIRGRVEKMLTQMESVAQEQAAAS